MQLIAKNMNIMFGEIISKEQYSDIIRDKENFQFVKQICIDTCLSLKLSYDKNTIQKEVSVYGSVNAAETFSEVIAEYCTIQNPRQFAIAFIAEYKVYFKQ